MKFAAYVLSTLIGFLAGRYLFADSSAVYASLLISYHLFLAYLVFLENKEKGLSLLLLPTILTHTACIALLLGIAVLRFYIPLFGYIRYLIPALAPFESEWLFSGGRRKPQFEERPKLQPFPKDVPDEYNEFLKYLAQDNRPFNKPGMSVRDEHLAWMKDRAAKRAALQRLQAQAQAQAQQTAKPTQTSPK